MKIIALFIVLLLSLSASSAPSLEEYAYSKQWLRMGHYMKGLFGYESRPDRPEFFLSPEGKENPLAELKATIKAFKSDEIPKHLEWHPQCAYPSRKMVLERDLGLSFPQKICKDFEWWKSRINAKSLSLVFSSYFAGNPASMFGHTLIKFNSEADGPGKLRDFSLNFAADTQGTGGALYIVKGAFGGFPGFFSTDPYYVRVNEYSQGESRDLWEYRLKLDQNELELLLAHVWELKSNTFFDYFFFDENCSYMLLDILEVVKLDWTLTNGFFFYAMPIDTVRRLKDVDGIEALHYRPSFRKKMEERVNALSESQRSLLRKVIEEKLEFKTLKDRDVLEAYSSFLQFKRYEGSGDKELVTKVKNKINKVLVTRAKLGGISSFKENGVTEKYKKFDPLKSHDAFTMELSNSYREDIKGITDFKFRFALADLYNNDFGYPDFFELQAPNFSFRYVHETEKFYLQEVEIVSLLSLTPYTWATKDRAWGYNLKMERPNDYDSGSSINIINHGFYG
ncbi:MAG: DUF4105 domain-containing protein, partial [Halobacteriovoraceae bacterium]|nr:DUF4105 domain-containing protein [Halobacteriovoraceae bacterium]